MVEHFLQSVNVIATLDIECLAVVMAKVMCGIDRGDNSLLMEFLHPVGNLHFQFGSIQIREGLLLSLKGAKVFKHWGGAYTFGFVQVTVV